MCLVPFLPVPAGFAFIYMKDKRDGDEAIRKLDNLEFGYKRRRLRVEWAKVGQWALSAGTISTSEGFCLICLIWCNPELAA